MKPFGGDDSLPTAKRPSDKKVVNEITKPKTTDIIPKDEYTEVSLKSMKKMVENQDPSSENRQIESLSLEKIVDMPLITSANLVSVIQDEENVETEVPEANQKNVDVIKTEKKISIARTPAIKKPENEKPRISVQNSYSNKGEYAVTKITKRTDIMNSENRNKCINNSGIEVTLTPIKNDTNEDRTSLMKGKDVNKIAVPAAEEKTRDSLILGERKIEGEVDSKNCNVKESRESAGEPDGKADEDMSEPPALPKSLPPMEVKMNNCSLQSEPKCMLITAEPRTSFLHGDSKIKPTVPQKPTSFFLKGFALSSITTASSTSSNITDNIIPSSTKNSPLSSFVLPPPSVQNPSMRNQISSRTDSNEEVKDHSITRNCNYSNSTIINSENKNCGDQEQFTTYKTPQSQVQSCQNVEVELLSKLQESLEPKESSLKSLGLGSPPRPKPPTLSLLKTLQNDEEVENDEEDIENLDSSSEMARALNKRRMAPRPPATPTDDLPGSLFARNTMIVTKSDSPVKRKLMLSFAR